jgi:DNA helicase-2/ATP-dependent DNA helicase PcrA
MTAFDTIVENIEQKKSFVLEAGAGSGKTYTLIQTINYLLDKNTAHLKLKNKRIVCITYTNVAKNEIIDRLENNPLVIVSTIHEFLWDCIKFYNRQLVIELDKLNTLMHQEEPDKFIPGLIDRINQVKYNDSSYRDFEIGQIYHDDVITLSKNLFENYPLLTTIVSEKYPFILVDEYQDTADETVIALIDYLLERNKDKMLVGFYGDSYQKIYDSGVGSLQNYIQAKKLSLVTKEENYRSSQNVVNLLNEVRSNIVQTIPEGTESIVGSAKFINCNNYPIPPKKGIIEYEKSIIPTKNANYEKVVKMLEGAGWNFRENSKDKVLIIANSRVATRGGFGNLYKIFSNRFGERANEALLKRENPFVSFFLGSIDKKSSQERQTGIEHLISFWEAKDYNNIMRFLRKVSKTTAEGKILGKHEDKKIIRELIEELIQLRKTRTVKDVFEFTEQNKLSVLPKYVVKYQERIAVDISMIEEEKHEKHVREVDFYNALMALPYSEYINLFAHTQDQTVFSTKHGTKGEEYRNVLVVIDDTSWKQMYNFEAFIDNTELKFDRKLRTQNLFYVSCSRAKENLVVLALSEMKTPAMRVINNWFDPQSVCTINDIPDE